MILRFALFIVSLNFFFLVLESFLDFAFSFTDLPVSSIVSSIPEILFPTHQILLLVIVSIFQIIHSYNFHTFCFLYSFYFYFQILKSLLNLLVFLLFSGKSFFKRSIDFIHLIDCGFLYCYPSAAKWCFDNVYMNYTYLWIDIRTNIYDNIRDNSCLAKYISRFSSKIHDFFRPRQVARFSLSGMVSHLFTAYLQSMYATTVPLKLL